MTPRGEWPISKYLPQGWFKPPATLFLILFLLTLVSISALSWFGWRLFEQERLVEAQRSHERLEQAADRIAATIRSTVAETGDRLGEWENTAADSPGLVLRIQDDTLSVVPPGRLLYYPFASREPEASASLFSDAEQTEFAQRAPQKALAIYQRLIVEAMWNRVAGIAGRSFQVRLSKPVRAGNKLTGRARITTITHRSERHDAVVIVSSNITTEDGETVLAVVLDTLVAARPAPRA